MKHSMVAVCVSSIVLTAQVRRIRLFQVLPVPPARSDGAFPTAMSTMTEAIVTIRLPIGGDATTNAPPLKMEEFNKMSFTTLNSSGIPQLLVSEDKDVVFKVQSPDSTISVTIAEIDPVPPNDVADLDKTTVAEEEDFPALDVAEIRRRWLGARMCTCSIGCTDVDLSDLAQRRARRRSRKRDRDREASEAARRAADAAEAADAAAVMEAKRARTDFARSHSLDALSLAASVVSAARVGSPRLAAAPPSFLAAAAVQSFQALSDHGQRQSLPLLGATASIPAAAPTGTLVPTVGMLLAPPCVGMLFAPPCAGMLLAPPYAPTTLLPGGVGVAPGCFMHAVVPPPTVSPPHRPALLSYSSGDLSLLHTQHAASAAYLPYVQVASSLVEGRRWHGHLQLPISAVVARDARER